MDVWVCLVKYKNGTLSYKESVSLYFQLYPQSSLRSFFEVEDRHSRKKLKEGLETKYKEFEANVSQNSFKSFTASKNAKKAINLEALPEELRTEYARLSPIIREICSLHARLEYFPDDKTRYEAAKRIVELSAQRRMIFTRIDTFQETGTDPMRKIDSPAIKLPAKLEKNYETEYQLKLLRSQRSKLKNNPRRIAEYQAVCKQITELLNKRYE